MKNHHLDHQPKINHDLFNPTQLFILSNNLNNIAATNTSMNADGDLFKQAGDISKQTAKDTTDKEALKSYAIAGGSALLTLGLTAGIDNIANATNTTNVMNNSAVSAIKHSLVQTVSSSTVQSAINGDSFAEAFKNSTKNLLINAAGELIANQIGQAAKPSIVVDNQGNIISYKSALITQTTQLSLHAALGCAMASAGGNNCASGAAAGVIGELTANYLDNNTNLSNQQIIETSKLTGALTSAAIAGPDDGNSVFAGSQIARNAAENNALAPGAIVGGVVGATGAMAGAYIEGERDPVKLAIAAAVGGTIGMVSGGLANPSGVLQGIRDGATIGAFGGSFDGVLTTYLTNPNATPEQLANSALKGAISGGIGGAVAGGFANGIGKVGFAGEAVAGMMGLGAGVSASAINNQYNLFNLSNKNTNTDYPLYITPIASYSLLNLQSFSYSQNIKSLINQNINSYRTQPPKN